MVRILYLEVEFKAKFSEAANGFEQFESELTGLWLLSERTGILSLRQLAQEGSIIFQHYLQLLAHLRDIEIYRVYTNLRNYGITSAVLIEKTAFINVFMSFHLISRMFGVQCWL